MVRMVGRRCSREGRVDIVRYSVDNHSSMPSSKEWNTSVPTISVGWRGWARLCQAQDYSDTLYFIIWSRGKGDGGGSVFTRRWALLGEKD